jgi:hypothetical protein
MNADFLDAHRRHLCDADYLFNASHLANADQLYGMAAECGLKQLMLAFGMKVRAADGAPEKREDREHIDKLWIRYEAYRSGTVQGVQYGLPSSSPFPESVTPNYLANNCV